MTRRRVEPAPPAKPQAAQHEDDAPSISLDSPAEVWVQLIQRIESISAYAWVDKIELAEMDAQAGLCKVRPRKGHRGIAGFVNARQCDRLAAELTKLTAKRFRIELVDATPPQHAQPTQGKATSQSGAGQRRKALDLPLVKDVFDVFPEAVLLDARTEREKDDEKSSD